MDGDAVPFLVFGRFESGRSNRFAFPIQGDLFVGIFAVRLWEFPVEMGGDGPSAKRFYVAPRGQRDRGKYRTS